MTKRDQIQKEAVETIIKNNFKGVIDISPRFGKTKLLIDSVKGLKDKKILVTVPFNSILESWDSELKQWYPDNTNITVINQRSLSGFNLEPFNLIVCDEIHTLSDLQIMILRNSNKTILGATGSLGKTTKKLLKLNLGLKVIYEYSIEQAINDGIISNYVLNIHYVKLDNVIKNNISVDPLQ
jgi:superfamily II DNA or RNA helicase